MCHAVYSGDVAGMLIALNAKALVSGTGYRTEMQLEEFYTGSGVKPNILKYNEILECFPIPRFPHIRGFSIRSCGCEIPLISLSWAWRFLSNWKVLLENVEMSGLSWVQSARVPCF